MSQQQPTPKDLRDEFAIAALNGFLASYDRAYEFHADSGIYEPGAAARRSYEIADAMMAERERRQQ